MYSDSKEVLVPMTPQQYEYWKTGLYKIEVEMQSIINNITNENIKFREKNNFLKKMIETDPKFEVKVSFDETMSKHIDIGYRTYYHYII